MSTSAAESDIQYNLCQARHNAAVQEQSFISRGPTTTVEMPCSRDLIRGMEHTQSLDSAENYRLRLVAQQNDACF